MRYLFKNANAPAVVVWAKSASVAWQKLQRTHAFYFCRNGWTLHAERRSA